MSEQKSGSLMLRLPADAKSFIEAEAKRNLRSQNSEIVLAIREKMERSKAAAQPAA